MNQRTTLREIAHAQEISKSTNNSSFLLTGIVVGLSIASIIYYSIESKKVLDYFENHYKSNRPR